MIQATAISFKSVVTRRRQRTARKYLIGLSAFVLFVAGFFYYWRFSYSKIVQASAPAKHIAPVATATASTAHAATASAAVRTATAPTPTRPVTTPPAATKPEPSTGSPKIDAQPTLVKNDLPVTTKAANVSFADSMMAAVVPSANAATVQHEMQPAPKQVTVTVMPAKRIPLQTAAAASPLSGPQAMTAEQKRLQIAQDGFAKILDVAVKYPDTYGFSGDERLYDSKLGDPIPVYRIAQQGGERYAGQPVSSLFKPVDEWLYPIILDNQIRYLVQVRFDGQNYVLGHGSRALAMAYEKILARWPASEGFHPQLLTVPGQPFYYFSIPELPDQNVTDTSRMFDLSPSLSPATLVLAGLW